MDIPRHDADLALAGLNDAGAVRADEPRRGLPLQMIFHFDHVVLRHALGDGFY